MKAYALLLLTASLAPVAFLAARGARAGCWETVSTAARLLFAIVLAIRLVVAW